MDYTRTPGPQLSLNYHGALWEEGQWPVQGSEEGTEGGQKTAKVLRSTGGRKSETSQVLVFNKGGSMRRQGQRHGLNEEEQQERDPSMCDSGPCPQVLALD